MSNLVQYVVDWGCLQKASRPLPFLIGCHFYLVSNLVMIRYERSNSVVSNNSIIFSLRKKSITGITSKEKQLSRPLHDVPSVTDFFLLWINDCWTPEPTPLSLRSLWSAILSLFYPIHGDINALEYSSAWSFSPNYVPSVTENFKWPTCSFIESKLKIKKISMKVWYCNLEMVKYSDH